MGGKPYLDSNGKFVLDVMRYANRLPKDQKPIFLEGMMAGLQAINEGHVDKVQQAMEILQSEEG